MWIDGDMDTHGGLKKGGIQKYYWNDKLSR